MKMKREIQYTILNRDEQEDHDKYQSLKRGRSEEEGGRNDREDEEEDEYQSSNKEEEEDDP